MTTPMNCPGCSAPMEARERGVYGCRSCELSGRAEVLARLAARPGAQAAAAGELALKAVAFVLDQAQAESDTYRVLGWGTAAFTLLCAAEAAGLRKTPIEVEMVRAFCRDTNQSTVEVLNAQLARLRKKLDAQGGG